MDSIDMDAVRRSLESLSPQELDTFRERFRAHLETVFDGLDGRTPHEELTRAMLVIHTLVSQGWSTEGFALAARLSQVEPLFLSESIRAFAVDLPKKP